MVSTQYKRNNETDQNSRFIDEQINKVAKQLLPDFSRTLKVHLSIHLLFALTALVQVIFLTTSFILLMKSFFLAFCLALLFLTSFSYFALRLYLKAKKPEQLREIYQNFLKSCHQLVHYQEDMPEHQVALSNGFSRFAAELHEYQRQVYRLPHFLKPLHPVIENLSDWLHWQEVHQMRELLLLGAVEFSKRLVKCEPTSLEAHAALASAYVALSTLYVVPEETSWAKTPEILTRFEEKYKETAERAIEEFKILNSFSPDDPWIHLQLAYSYHDLKMPKEEIGQYEELLRLCPGDKETFYKLGVLYFQQGMNADGLAIYEKLRRSSYDKAEQLIRYYGAYDANG